MNLKRMIISSVLSAPVFRRFAQMSDEDKAKVVEKVKEKVNGKGNGKPADEGFDEEAFKAELESAELTDEEASVLDEDVKAEVDEDEETPNEEISDEAKPDVDKPAVETTIEDSSDEEGQGMDQIVNDLVEEVETIKSDGKIEPAEVFGLIDNMVQMVQSLLGAKPARARKSAIAQRVREEVIVSKMVAKEFGTKEELAKYLKDHPKSDSSRHTVKTNGKAPVKEEKEKSKDLSKEEKKKLKTKGKKKVEKEQKLPVQESEKITQGGFWKGVDGFDYSEAEDTLKKAWAGVDTWGLGEAAKNKESDPKAYATARKENLVNMKEHAKNMVKEFGDNASTMALSYALDSARVAKKDKHSDSAAGQLEGMKLLVGAVKKILEKKKAKAESAPKKKAASITRRGSL